MKKCIFQNGGALYIHIYYLDDININDACDELTEKNKDTLDLYAPLKTIKIPHKNIIRDPWMTKIISKIH